MRLLSAGTLELERNGDWGVAAVCSSSVSHDISGNNCSARERVLSVDKVVGSSERKLSKIVVYLSCCAGRWKNVQKIRVSPEAAG